MKPNRGLGPPSTLAFVDAVMFAAHATFAFALLTFAAGCKGNTTAAPRLRPVQANTLVRDEPIVFQSWGGRWLGSDSDTELTLNPDGTALFSYFGYAQEQANGTWSVTDNELTLSLPFPVLTQMPGATDWPTLQTMTADGKLYLVPTRETEALQYPHGSAWPLGEIPNDEP